MKCPQCESELKPVTFDIGYGVKVGSQNCQTCGFNMTEKGNLQKAIDALQSQMAKETRIIRIGNGLGVRFPNEIVRHLKLKQGKEILMQPDAGGIRIVI